jgi:hypothetical protein
MEVSMRTKPSVVPLDDFFLALASKRTLESKEHSIRRFMECVAIRDPMTPLDGTALYLGSSDPVLALSIDPSEMSAGTVAVQFRGPLMVRHLREALDGESALALDAAVMRMHHLHHSGAKLSENAEARSEIMHIVAFIGLEVSVIGLKDVQKNGIVAHVVCGQR